MPICLCERLTFDKLFRISDPKRVYRSFTVRGPPLEIDSYQDTVYYTFNFKANPSTTGLRHRGYLKFFKPKNKNPKDIPLQHLECLVDCECPDFRYRWAWANKQRQSSVVGPQSLNQAWNKAPRITNPHGKPGLCKHILAARAFIYGLLSSFEGDEPDTAEKLNKLTKHATKRWTDFEGQMAAAKAKEREIRRRREQYNLGQVPLQPEAPALPELPVAEPPEAETPDELKPAPAPEPAPLAKPPGQRGRTMPVPPPTQKPLAVPPGQRGRNMPTGQKPAPQLAVPPGQRGRTMPTGKPITKPKRVIGNRKVKPLESIGWIRAADARLCEPMRDLILESVVNANSESMSNIQEALKLVQEMETDELSRLGSEDAGAGAPPVDFDGMGGDVGGDTLAPSEPPMSDSAIGADTEGESALAILRSIDNSLQQIVAAVAPPELPPGDEMGMEGGDMGAPGGGAGGPPMDAGGDMPMPDEPPGDIEGAEEEGAEIGAEEGAEEAAEEGGEEGPPKPKAKKPKKDDE